MIRRPRRSPLFPYPTLFRSLAAGQRSVAFEPSGVTAGESCRDPIDRIAALAGTRLDDGWARRLADAIGGPRGCPHPLTLGHLPGPRAALALARQRALPRAPPARAPRPPLLRPRLRDDRHATAAPGMQL